VGIRSSAPSLAIVGVTGAVGQEFLAVLEQRNFPFRAVKMLASARSAGKTQAFKGKPYTIEELTESSFQGVDIALFSAGSAVSKKFGPLAAAAGTVVVDNSSCFRQTAGIPLVVPEVNPQALAGIAVGSGKGAIIANPNCSTIIALVAVTPLHRVATVVRMLVSTYQAASGAGYAAMLELEQQTRDVLAGKPAQMKIFPQQYAFNLFSHNSEMQPNGYNAEEMKMVHETHKIWEDSAPSIAATCVRVPVMRAHAESINLTFAQPLGEDDARRVLGTAPGVALLDDRAHNRFPTPLDASQRDDVYVGRIRRDISQEGNRGLNLFVCGDQLRKGAALNAVQIAELLL
jgi:aspartate-semialdehyde dehydrogenase